MFTAFNFDRQTAFGDLNVLFLMGMEMEGWFARSECGECRVIKLKGCLEGKVSFRMVVPAYRQCAIESGTRCR